MNNNCIYAKAKKILGKRAKLFNLMPCFGASKNMDYIIPRIEISRTGVSFTNRRYYSLSELEDDGYPRLESIVKLTHGKPKHLVIKQLLGL